ncbi:unnamed protein product [Meloidogyne enterolobii]|uniref:Uncharacterized protein n=1 Tax=Meloidogyne enterolobii TaxID=390850 RepID=A0ACB0XQ15_MELEN
MSLITRFLSVNCLDGKLSGRCFVPQGLNNIVLIIKMEEFGLFFKNKNFLRIANCFSFLRNVIPFGNERKFFSKKIKRLISPKYYYTYPLLSLAEKKNFWGNKKILFSD